MVNINGIPSFILQQELLTTILGLIIGLYKVITFCLSFVVKMVNYNVLNIRSNFKRKQICIHSARS